MKERSFLDKLDPVKSIARKLALAAALLGLAAGVTLAASSGDGVRQIQPAGACQKACFAEKSRAYAGCRALPPGDQKARAACFKRADAALRRCLARCR